MSLRKDELLSNMDESQLHVTRLLEDVVSDIINGRNVSERIQEIDDALDSIDKKICTATLDRTASSSLNKLKNELLFLKIDLLLLLNSRQ